MANSAEPDQLAPSEANWSGSSLFAKAGYTGIQQDKGLEQILFQKGSWNSFDCIASLESVLFSPKFQKEFCEVYEPK